MERASGKAIEGIDLGSALLSLTLLLEILAVAFGSLMPLTLVDSWATVWDALQTGLSLEIHPPIWATLSERLLTFLPMGLLAYLQMDRLGRRPLLASAVLVALVALAIEVVQATIVGRHPRLSDFLLATLFGCAGAAIGRALQYAMDRVGPAGRPHGSDAESAAPISAEAGRMLRWGLIGAIVLCNATILGILTITHSGLSIAGWDCRYPLLVGNELTQERPWLGKLRGLAIYDRVPDDAVIRQLSRLPMTADNSAVRRQAGAQIVYAFDAAHGSRLPNLGLAKSDDLSARIEGPPLWTIAGGVLDIRGPLLIRSNAPPKTLCEQILRSQALAVEVEFAAASSAQAGPARIVSLSTDIQQRNFTLGQENGKLDLRVRTPRRGLNGMSLPMQTAEGSVVGSWQHVLATYDKSRSEIFIDGEPAIVDSDAHTLLLVDEGRLVPVDEIAGFLYFVAGTAAALLLVGRSFTAAWLLGFSAAATAPLLYVIALGDWYGYGFDWTHLATAVIASCFASIVVRTIVRFCSRSHRTQTLGTRVGGQRVPF
ncbi:MAG: hypothetical protein AB7S71_21920 [Dongiaceae bacterium]